MTSEEDQQDPGTIPDIVIDKAEPPHVFCQMDVLRPFNEDFVWKELKRWVKFEESLEEDGKRWSKPHVSSLCMQYLTELHLIVTANPILLDLEANSMFEIVDILLENWTSDGTIQPILWNHIRSILLKKHKHKILHKSIRKHLLPRIRSETQISNSDDEDVESSTNDLRGQSNKGYEESNENVSNTKTSESPNNTKETPLSDGEVNKSFKRKIPPGSEVMNIMIGDIEDLKGNLCAFIRLQEARDIGMITEVDLPTRFLFILLVPKGNIEPAIEAGRCMGTLITDEIFREIAYKAETQLDILCGIQEFTSQTTVLPPGCWDITTRIEPPENLPTKEFRDAIKARTSMKEKTPSPHIDPTLQRTGRLFGGLVEDIKRKLPWYKSDFTDAIHIQCIASFLYLFLATLTPNVTFGGLLGLNTDNFMGPMECILAAAITGVAFALFSGQPLNILGSTGPMLVLEMILFKFCNDQDWDYMPFRCWVGLWVALYILIVVALDLSALVRYITRFTEESFACLIALIFIYQAFENIYHLEKDFPVHFHVPIATNDSCTCTLPNLTIPINRYTNNNLTAFTTNVSNFSGFPTGGSFLIRDEDAKNELMLPDNCSDFGGILTGSACDATKYVPDVFFLSVLLFLGTFGLAVFLVNFKNGRVGTTTIRQVVSDFGVLLAIILMVCLDALLGIPTPKLEVPSEFKPTNPARGWFINPWSDRNPWWVILAASIPALLTMILVFMDQQITAVIVNRPAHKLKKGGGYHLDMLVLAILMIILSLLGLPWYVAATVSALAHIISLRKESECTAPGEKPKFLGVREQRVTALLVGILSGFAVLITSVLRYIPMAVLYGVFLYMGVAALRGMELVQRISIMFMPKKYQPDYKFLRHVPLGKVHLFTAIQIACLVVLWVIKSIKKISIIFPLMVLGTCFVRKAMNCLFSDHDLKWLDGTGGRKPKKEEPPKENKKRNKLSKRERCKSLPADVNGKYRPSFQSIDESSPIGSTLAAFDKRTRKVSLMALPNDSTYRKTSQQSVHNEFQLSIGNLHRALSTSQENMEPVRNMEIYDKRRTRRPSLLSIPSDYNTSL